MLHKRMGHKLNSIYFLCAISVLSALSAMGAVWVSATEIDSFTRRSEFLPDLTDLLNQEVMMHLQKAVKHSNRISRKEYLRTNYPFRGKEGTDYCNSDHLYARVRSKFARPLIGQLESFINRLPESRIRKLNFNQSIYKDFLFKESPTLAGTKRMGSLVRVGDHIIGADKFGHFFTEGWSYYRLAYTHELDLERALLFGKLTESLYYGASTTGVYSYADLAANFNGMRFWNALLGRHADALYPEQKQLPYIRCINKRWEFVREFKWSDYIDAAWDECVNYSLFRNKELLDKVLARIESLNVNDLEYCYCAEELQTIVDQLYEKYDGFEEHILNFSGHDILPLNLMPQSLLDQYRIMKKRKKMPGLHKRMFDSVKEKLKKRREAGQAQSYK